MQAQPKRRKSTRLKMTDIARLAGVDKSTVSRALADSPLIPEHRRAEILRIAREHGYVANQAARSLRLRRTNTIGVVIPLGHEVGQLVSDPFFLGLFGHLADEIMARHYDVLLVKMATPTPGWLGRLIQSGRADGLIVIGQSDQHESLNEAASHYLPMVVWGGHLPNQTYCSVGVDNIGGARLAIDHLIRRCGRKRIVFLGPLDAPEVALRREGYLRALKQANLSAEPALIIPAHFTGDAAYDAVQTLRERGISFDAIFAASDVIAIQAMRALTTGGIRVPKDVAVVGFDDLEIARHATPPLTTVQQDLKRGAAMMVDLLFRRLQGEQTPSATMPGELIVRESCGAGEPAKFKKSSPRPQSSRRRAAAGRSLSD